MGKIAKQRFIAFHFDTPPEISSHGVTVSWSPKSTEATPDKKRLTVNWGVDQMYGYKNQINYSTMQPEFADLHCLAMAVEHVINEKIPEIDVVKGSAYQPHDLWGEVRQDLRNVNGLDAETELANILQQEIDREIIDRLAVPQIMRFEPVRETRPIEFQPIRNCTRPRTASEVYNYQHLSIYDTTA